MEEKIISYLIDRYNPEGIIKYGSFADGSNNAGSDFDALLIANCPKQHDSTVVDGVVLDVFIYPPESLESDFDPEEFVQIFDGEIILDKNGRAATLKAEILQYLNSLPKKTQDEIAAELDWCRKMLSRTERGDPEGLFRHHWLLCDSLEIYFDVLGKRYFGPKKALRLMSNTDPDSYKIYTRALENFSTDTLREWVNYLTNL